MARILKEWIESGAVGSDAITLENASYLKGRNNADNADVNIIRVTATDTLELAAKVNDPDSTAPTADTQLANKKYVDDQVASISIPSVFELQGNWSATTNTPTLANTDVGVANYLYYVNAAGTVDFGAGSKTFAVGDWVYNVNGAWEKADNNDDVLSVNGQTGTVVLDADDIDDTSTAHKFVTAAQVSLIDSATQPGDNISTLTNDSAFVDAAGARTAAVVNSSAGSETDQAMSVSAAKAYTDSAVAGVARNFATEKFTLIAGDITNGYVDLANTPLSGSIHVTPKGGILQDEGVDYTVLTNRITFAGDLSTYLSAGDILIIKYAY